MAPNFLTLEEVIEIHQDQLSRYGGAEGILNRDSLESAIAQPQASFAGQYLLTDLFEMAASYLFHLVQNHAFADGNKRVGAVSAIVFLLINDQDINLTDDALEALTRDVAQGKLDRAAVALFLRTHAA